MCPLAARCLSLLTTIWVTLKGHTDSRSTVALAFTNSDYAFKSLMNMAEFHIASHSFPGETGHTSDLEGRDEEILGKVKKLLRKVGRVGPLILSLALTCYISVCPRFFLLRLRRYNLRGLENMPLPVLFERKEVDES